MEQVADIKLHQGPDMIKSEGARRTASIFVDIRDIDLGTYIQKAKEAMQAHLKLPPGYNLLWSGQFEYMETARERLPGGRPHHPGPGLSCSFYLSTQSLVKVIIIMLSLPFSVVGSIWLLYFLGYNFSLGVLVGIIAMVGLDAETGVIMLLYQDIVYHQRQREGRLQNRADLVEAVKGWGVVTAPA